MKRKFFAMLMSVVLCAGLLPSGALADVPEQTFEEEAAEAEYTTDSGTGDAKSAEPENEADTGAVDTGESESDFSIQNGTGDDGTPVPDEVTTEFPEETEGDGTDSYIPDEDPEAFTQNRPDAEGEENADPDADGGETTEEEEEEEEEEKAAEEDEEAEEAGDGEDTLITLTFDGGDYTVTVTCGPDAGLPEDAVLSAWEYAQDSDMFEARLKEAEAICGWDEEDGAVSARLFDVFLSADGEEVEPDAPVSVSISYKNQEEMTDYTVVHFGDVTETVLPENSLADEIQTMSFDLDSFSDIMVLSFEGTSYDVIFTTSNDNGLANTYTGSGTLFSGGYNGGSRAAVSGSALADFAETDGTISIRLPSDGDLGSAFAVYTDTDTGSTETVTLNNIDAHYDYALAGWYNLGTGRYYDVSGGPVTAEINLSDRNVFYADYYAASYNVGYDNGNLADSVSTDFVTIRLFDYNELFNLYSTNAATGAGGSGEVFTDSGNFYTAPAVLDRTADDRQQNAAGISSFITKYNYIGRSNSGDTGYQANIFYPGGLFDWNEWQESYNLKNAESIWGITSPDYSDNALLNMLFNPDTTALGVKYIGTSDYLFQYGTEENGAPEQYVGYYYYSSNYNAAAYNQSAGRFYVYNGVESYSDSNMFLPFQDYDRYQQNGTGTDDLNVNYLFGMSMQVDFYLPNAVNGETVGAEGAGNVDINGNDLEFYYSGDDDILIFVDDTLVLDMSGIHLEADGSINFNTGRWLMENVDDSRSGPLNLAAGSHRLTVYYLERGTGYSNLTVSFNVVPIWYYETGDIQTIEARKVWVDADYNVIEDTAGLPDVSVGLFAALGEGERLDNGSYQFTDDQNRVHTFTCSEDTYIHAVNGETVETSTVRNGDGRFVDEQGRVLAWTDPDGGDTADLYVRVDVQSLGESNVWAFDWEMRDPEESYVVLELENAGYTLADTAVADSVTHYYWSVIGETEIESDLADADLSRVKLILTDGAQHKTGDDTLGDTSEAAGWVLVADAAGSVRSEPVTFSQIGTLKQESGTGETTPNWYGMYGVTTESEIGQYGDGAVWYLQDAYDTQDDTTGEKIESFYLYCVIDGSSYYLTLGAAGTLGVTGDGSGADEFYYNSLGELRIVQPGGDTRVEIDADGNIILAAASESPDSNDVRIYTLTDMVTSGNVYTFTNLLPEDPVKSVDIGSGTPVDIGGELSYTIAFFNDKNTEATVTVTDVLDEGLDFISATDGGTYSAETRTVTWVLEGVAALGRRSVSFTAAANEKALSKGVIPNTADVQIDHDAAVQTNTVENPVEPEPDPDPGIPDDGDSEVQTGPGPEIQDPDDDNPVVQTEPGPVILDPDDGNPDILTEPGPAVQNPAGTITSQPDGGSSDGSNPNPAGTAKTGDTNRTTLWITLMIAAAVLVAALVTVRTRRPRVRK